MTVRRPRVVHGDARVGASVRLPPTDAHHLRQVLRLRTGAEVEVLDGRGRAYLARLQEGEPTTLEVSAALGTECSSGVAVALAVLRSNRMDLAVEKLSELGVASLLPLHTERSRGQIRQERWRRIASESAKQCGRSQLLAVADPVAVAELAQMTTSTCRILLDPAGAPIQKLAPAVRVASSVLLVVGPESGLTPAEIAILSRFELLGLGPHTLRAETAAIAGAAVVMALRHVGPAAVDA